jgi:hypothetical protein
MNFLKNIFSRTKPIKQRIGVTKYPDKILVETIHQIKNSYSIRGVEISLLNSDTSELEIGKTIMKHLALSKSGIKSPNDQTRKETNEAYKRITGLKTMKAQMKDSLYVLIDREGNKIEFTPTINGGSSGKAKGYDFLPNDSLTIDHAEDFELIGSSFNLVLHKCR